MENEDYEDYLHEIETEDEFMDQLDSIYFDLEENEKWLTSWIYEMILSGAA